MNNVVGSQNGVFLDGQSSQNTISANNVLENVIDLNNANGLPTNINANQYTDNSCQYKQSKWSMYREVIK